MRNTCEDMVLGAVDQENKHIYCCVLLTLHHILHHTILRRHHQENGLIYLPHVAVLGVDVKHRDVVAAEGTVSPIPTISTHQPQ